MKNNRIIIFLSPIYSPDKGGASTYFGMLANWSLENSKVKLVIVITSKSKYKKFIEFEKNFLIIRPFLTPGLKLRWKLFGLVNLLVGILLTIPLLFFRIFNFSKEILIHAHTRRYFLPLLYIGKFLGVKTVVDVRDVGGICFSKVSDHEVSCSPLVSHIRPNSKYMPIPIQFERLETNKDVKGNKKYCIYVGDITKRKGVDVILEIFSKKAHGYSKMDLLLIGRAVEPSLINEISSSNIKYLGEMKWEELTKLIKLSDCLLLPTKSDLFPRVVVEGLYLGVKVLTTNSAISFSLMHDINNLYIAEGNNVKEILKCLNFTMKQNLKAANYPFDIHQLRNLSNKYEKYYDELFKK